MYPVENTPPLGPLPDDPVPAGLSGARRTVLALLHERSAPTTLNELVELSGLHENTLRGHLDGLATEGLVRRERAAPEGRGRPAWLWSVVPGGVHSEYAGLAGTLAATLSRTSADPAGDARTAGKEWGRALAADRPLDPEAPDIGARAGTLRLLEGLGFGPEGPPERVRLTRCPLLEAARRHPEIVCHVHEGLVEGALETYGDQTTRTTLRPFSEPGACLLLLSDQTRP